jgi:hypothetical protein
MVILCDRNGSEGGSQPAVGISPTKLQSPLYPAERELELEPPPKVWEPQGDPLHPGLGARLKLDEC